MIPMQGSKQTPTAPSPRRQVELPNFSASEGGCACGKCGLLPAESVVFATQALALNLAREYGAPVRIIVTGGVRCKARHLWVYEHEVNPIRRKKGLPELDPPEDSRHLPPHSDALDFRMEVLVNGRWSPIPLDIVAMHARKVGLFGGLGIDEYRKDGRDMIHGDCRPGRLVTW